MYLNCIVPFTEKLWGSHFTVIIACLCSVQLFKPYLQEIQPGQCDNILDWAPNRFAILPKNQALLDTQMEALWRYFGSGKKKVERGDTRQEAEKSGWGETGGKKEAGFFHVLVFYGLIFSAETYCMIVIEKSSAFVANDACIPRNVACNDRNIELHGLKLQNTCPA